MSTDVIDLAPARRQSMVSLLAGWTNGGLLIIYSDPRPASSSDPAGSAILLTSLPFDDPSGTVTNGVWNANPMQSVIVATGTAFWARIVDDTGVTIADASVGITGSGEAVTLDTVELVSGYTVICTSCRIAT